MKVVITAATEKELEHVRKEIAGLNLSESVLQILFHKSGVGMLATGFSLTKLIYEQKPDLILQVGIAGAFESLSLGKVVIVRVEYIADLGVEEEATFKDIFDMNLLQENEKPFIKKGLTNPHLHQLNLLKLDEVTGVTVNEITTQPKRIQQLKEKYAPAIESMEGAALHYCCLQTSTPFIQIRSISNMVGERDKTKWNFELAFNNLSDVASKYIQRLTLL